MALVVTNEGEQELLKHALGVTNAGNLTLRLFVNDKTPAPADTSASYTEFSGMGYSAMTLTTTSWSTSSVSGTAEASYPIQTWTFTAGGPVTAFGYYVTDASSKVIFAERFDSPYVVENAGDIIKITPKLTVRSEF